MLRQFAASERAVFARLKSPSHIQEFLDEKIAYNHEPGGATCFSPRLVLRHRVAHCMEGALLAAAGLRLLGYPPLLVDLEAVRDSDHVVAVYRRNGHWGAIAKSNYAGLRSREPVYRTIRELAISYFEHYFNDKGEKTLRAYSAPVNLKRFDRAGDRKQGWMMTEEEVWEIPSYLCDVQHKPVVPKAAIRQLSLMDKRLYDANCLGKSVPDGDATQTRPHPRQR